MLSGGEFNYPFQWPSECGNQAESLLPLSLLLERIVIANHLPSLRVHKVSCNAE